VPGADGRSKSFARPAHPAVATHPSDQFTARAGYSAKDEQVHGNKKGMRLD
jgi:hypothetical protein